MEKKGLKFQPIGISMDMQPLLLDSKYATYLKNIRLTTIGDNGTLSISNEKGNKSIDIKNENGALLFPVRTKILGTLIINNYLILFCSGGIAPVITDSIYRLELKEEEDTTDLYFEYKQLYSGTGNPLNFQASNPLQTIGIYENEEIQKVYWIDGINTPKVINITKTYTNANDFNFAPELELNETVSIEKKLSGGLFPLGTIQYAFNYYNKYGLQSNIAYLSPINYLAYNKGVAPDESVNCSFNITIKNVDPNFLYLRLYSIIRTTADATPIVKRVTDVEIKSTTITIFDDGRIGSTMDPTELLYIGGEDIIPETFEHKDGTLFFGNYRINSLRIPDTEKAEIIEALKDKISFVTKILNVGSHDYLNYLGLLGKDSSQITTFKYLEWYGVGIQFQFKNGKFSEPIYINRIQQTKVKPVAAVTNNTIYLALLLIDISSLSTTIKNKYKKIRVVIIKPEDKYQSILCQGILSTTLFNLEDRYTNRIYGVSDWRMRPFENYLYKQLSPYNYDDSEIQNVYDNLPLIWNIDTSVGAQDESSLESISLNTIQQWRQARSHYYYIDDNILTINTPDIEKINNKINENTKLRIVGVILYLYKNSDCIINYEIGEDNTSTLLAKRNGFIQPYIKKEWTKRPLWYLGETFTKTGKKASIKIPVKHVSPIYLWHNDANLIHYKQDGTHILSIALNKKIIYNIRSGNSYYFNKTATESDQSLTVISIDNNLLLDINKPSVILDLSQQYTYLDNELNKVLLYNNSEKDKILSSSMFKLLTGFLSFGSLSENADLADIISEYTIENYAPPVTLNYKTAPHIVVSLKNFGNTKVSIPCLKYKTYSRFTKSTNILELNDSSYDRGYNYIHEGLNFYAFIGTGSEADAALYTNPDDYEIGDIFIITDEEETSVAEVHLNEAGTKLLWDHINIKNTMYFTPKSTVHGLQYNIYYFDTTPSSRKLKLKLKTPYNTLVDRQHILPILSADLPYNLGTNATYSYIVELYNTVDNGDVRTQIIPIKELYPDLELQLINFIPAGNTYNLNNTKILGNQGDTYFMRWDCLKTMPKSNTDKNQCIDITSFFVESKINIDGRYDKYTRESDALFAVDETNFNLINPNYTLLNNYFNYNVLDTLDILKFPNQITWTKTKILGATIDTWTDITLLNTHDLDGDKGELTSINRYNNELYCFLNKGVSKLLYNTRVQVPVSDGVPIEISTGSKLQGHLYLSNIIGCLNKFSIAVSSNGVYFLDSNSSDIYLLNNQGLKSLSDGKVYKWVKNLPNTKWNLDNGSLRSLYDNTTGDIYFTTDVSCLAFNELLNEFTSFYSYELALYLETIGSHNFLITRGGTIWAIHEGDYNKYFGSKKGYQIDYISNDNFNRDKIFETVEFRSNDTATFNNTRSITTLRRADKYPFSELTVSNEYQNGTTNTNSLGKKFRNWRWQIPRGTNRDRIRNPWIKISLKQADNSVNTDKLEVYDIITWYYM